MDAKATATMMTMIVYRLLLSCGCLGFGLEALFLVVVGYTKDTVTAIACLTIAVGFSGFAISGKFNSMAYLGLSNLKCI